MAKAQEKIGPRCPRCRMIRTLLSSIVLGVGFGYAALYLGLGANLSMLATFVGAVAPVLWFARQNRIDRAG